MSYDNVRKHSYVNQNQESQPVPKKFRSQNDQLLNFADPPEKIFNSLKFRRKVESRTPPQIPSLNDTVSSVIPPPFPAFENNFVNVDDPVAETVTINSVGKFERPTTKKGQQYYHCKECQLFLSSQCTLDAHLAGARHAKKLKELEIVSSTDDLKKEKVIKLSENEFKCRICNVLAGSIIQIKSHIDGTKHKKKIKAYRDKKKLKRKPSVESVLLESSDF